MISKDIMIFTHSWVLLGAIRDDFYMVSIHIIAEEVIQVRLWPLASKHIQVSVSLFRRKGSQGVTSVAACSESPETYRI